MIWTVHCQKNVSFSLFPDVSDVDTDKEVEGESNETTGSSSYLFNFLNYSGRDLVIRIMTSGSSEGLTWTTNTGKSSYEKVFIQRTDPHHRV